MKNGLKTATGNPRDKLRRWVQRLARAERSGSESTPNGGGEEPLEKNNQQERKTLNDGHGEESKKGKRWTGTRSKKWTVGGRAWRGKKGGASIASSDFKFACRGRRGVVCDGVGQAS